MADVIVVGVDDSENAWHALDWAIAEARLRTATLKLVCAFENPAMVGLGTAFMTGAPDAFDGDAIEGAAKAVVDEAVGRVGDLPVEVVAKVDRPGDVLCQESLGAALLVVGSRGHGGVGRLLLGSVSNHVVHHATCPVVVVPQPQ